jgi:DNA-directed RNA polymerase subunit RPC12/RpoP
MSEFKYACPVCGQHIKCDSSQAGTQMQCPTCFQKIIVPQAPEGEQTFILTGSKVAGERPLPSAPDATPLLPRTHGFPGAAIVAIILLCIIAAVAFVIHGTLFKKPAPPPVAQNTPATPRPAPPKKPAPPPLIAPPANDTNWMLNLKGVPIPHSTAAGRINGQDFICQHATLTGGFLALHDGDGAFDVGFGNATAALLAGKTINVGTNATSAAHIILRWKDGDQTMHESFTNDYAMMLNFGNVTNNRIDGKIYLCTDDDHKSYVAGTFRADIQKRRPRNQ